MLAMSMPRKPAPMLAMWRVGARGRVGPRALGNAGGSVATAGPGGGDAEPASAYGYRNGSDIQSDSVHVVQPSGAVINWDEVDFEPPSAPKSAEQLQADFRRSEREYRQANDRSVPGSSHVVGPHDTDSSLVGNDAQAIGNFAVANNRTTSRLTLGENVFIPDSDIAYGDQGALGQDIQNQGNVTAVIKDIPNEMQRLLNRAPAPASAPAPSNALSPLVHEDVGPVDMSSKARERIFMVEHPWDAYQIGEVEKGSNNISTVASRFARQGADPAGDTILEVRTGVYAGEGDGNGAFRHAFWMAMITNQFGSDIALQVGYAHEDNPQIVNSPQRNFSYSEMPAADSMVDLLNNGIGREIGGKAPAGTSNLDLAGAVIDEYRKNGLWTATPTADGGWLVGKTILGDEQYQQFKNALGHKDNNGNWIPPKK
jgi:hypothetical protein